MKKTLAAAAVALLAFGSPVLAEPAANPLTVSETWAELRPMIFGEAEIRDGAGLLSMEAPYRAHDAALVPVEITQSQDAEARLVRLTLIVDENPAPVAAEFEFGPALGDLDLSTRVRVNAYSNVRAVAETAEGELYMVGRFVKASGGCSAPALKDAEKAMAELGRMKMRLFDDAPAMSRPDGLREAQVMLRHPNYSGLQMNQLTQLYIPARFVEELEVRAGDELVFRMTGGISISEDPSFRFTFRDAGEPLHVRAVDTDGEVFEQTFPASGGAG